MISFNLPEQAKPSKDDSTCDRMWAAEEDYYRDITWNSLGRWYQHPFLTLFRL